MGGASEVFRIVAKIQTNAKTAITELNAVHASGKNMANKLKASFTKVANFAKKVLIVGLVAITAAAAAMFVSAVKRAAAFEQSMAMVKAVTGATGKEFEDLEAKAKSLGQTSKFTMVQIAEGMEFLGRAGFTTTEIIDAMDGVTALAASQMMELGRAADITSNILTAFGLDASEAERVANVLAATAASANVNVEMLGDTMKYVAPLAAAAGWSLEEMAAAAGKLGDAGIQASMAGTALRMAIATLMEEGDPTIEALEKLSLTMDDLKDKEGNLLSLADIMGVLKAAGADASTMLDLFGKRAGPAMTILLAEGEESLESYRDEITGTNAAFEQMAIQQDTLSGQTTILKGSWDLFMVTIGQKIIPHLKTLVQDRLIPLVNRMVEWAEKTDIIDRMMKKFNDTIEWMIDNGPRLIKIIKGVGIAIAALGLAGFVMSLNPVKIVIMAVSAVVVLAIKHWDDLKKVFDYIKPLLPLIAAGFAAIVAVKIAAWAGIAVTSFSSLAAMLGVAGPVGLAIAAAAAGIILLRKALVGAAEDANAAIEKAEDLEGALSKASTATERTAIATEAMGAAINIAGGELVGLVENGRMSVITLSEITGRLDEMGAEAIAAGGSNAAMAQRIRDGVSDILNDYTDLVPGVSDALDRINERIGKAGEEVEELGDTTEETTGQFQRIGGAFDEVSATINTFGPRVVRATETTEDFAEKTRIAADALEDEREAIIETGGAVDDLGDTTDDAGDSVDDLGDNLEETGEEAETVAEKFARLKEAFASTTEGSYEQSQALGDLRSFYDELVGAQETLVESGIEVDQSLLDMIEDTRELIDVTEVETEAMEELRLAEHGLWEETQELIAAYEGSIEGGQRQAETLASLQSVYDETKNKIDLLGEQGIEASGDLLLILAALEKVGVEGEKKVSGFVGMMRDAWSEISDFIGNTLGDVLGGIRDYFRDKEQAAEEHNDRMLGIQEDYEQDSKDKEKSYQDSLTDGALSYERKREDIELDYTRAIADLEADDFEGRARVEKKYQEDLEDAAIGYSRRRQDLESDYVEEIKHLVSEVEQAKADEEQAYEDSAETIGQALWRIVSTALAAARDELWLLAAVEGAKAAVYAAAALIPIAGAWAIGPAASHGAAAGVAAVQAGLLSLAGFLVGFAEGGIALGPMMGIVGEGPDPELILPLNQSVLADVGAGIVQATQTEGMSMSSQEITVNVAEGATFHVREEGDIDRISRSLGEEFDIRLREEGLVVPA